MPYALKKEGIPMKVAMVQCTARLGDVEYNYNHVAALVKEAAGHDVAVIALPELWNTGFYPANVADLADVNGTKSKRFLSDLAATYGVALVGGSVACRRGKDIFNTTYVVDSKGHIIGSYDKVHLFTLGEEEKVFTPGDRANMFSLYDVPMASMICYDLRFGEWARVAALSGAQVIWVPAAWPVQRLRHWQILNTARAIENQCFVVAVNACGKTGDYAFAGHSLVIDPWGQCLAEGTDAEDIMYVDMQLDAVANARQGLHVFADRRPELYTLI